MRDYQVHAAFLVGASGLGNRMRLRMATKLHEIRDGLKKQARECGKSWARGGFSL